MHPNLEEAGSLVSATLAAHVIEGAPHVARAADAPATACLNCGTTLTGPYCHACGQAAHVERSLLHLSEEILHGVVHFDAKGWRTLPLLVAHPGRLTRRYIDGERVRYVSPLALFLFSVFLMFFVFSVTGGSVSTRTMSSADRVEVEQDLEQSRKEHQEAVDQARAALVRAREHADPAGMADAARELAAAERAQRLSQQTTEAMLSGLLKLPPGTEAPSTPASSTAGTAEGAGLAAWQSQLAGLEVHTGSAAFDARLHRALQNPELLLYKLKNLAYKFSFMLIPISLPLIWLMFIGKRGIAMYDHAVFSLYSLSFMWLLFTTVALVSAVHLDALDPFLVVLVPPTHMYRQLKGTYGLTRLGAAWRTVALLGVAGTAFAVFIASMALIALR